MCFMETEYWQDALKAEQSTKRKAECIKSPEKKKYQCN